VEDLAAAEAELDAIEHALQRLDDGSYGSCLVGDPTARYCAAHLPGVPA
jgi:RNA polymerase-binding transcription factor DksA